MDAVHVTAVEKLFVSAAQSNNFSGRLIKMPHIWQWNMPSKIRAVFFFFFGTCILVSCVISFEHINGRTKRGLSRGTSILFTLQVSHFEKMSLLET